MSVSIPGARRPGRSGLALPMVIMVSLVVLGIVLVGLGFASQNSLFVAGLHRREAARYAAEAGVYKVLAHLESQPSFEGTLRGTLEKSGATFEATIRPGDNQLPGAFAIVTSKGRAGRFVSTVQVKLAQSGESFEAVSAEGLLRTEGNAYANGIRSTRDARPEAAQVQSNSSADRAVDATGRFYVRGTVSAVGGIDPKVKADNLRPRTSTSPLSKVKRDELLAKDFATGSIPPNGFITSNLRVNGDTLFRGRVHLANGAVLHVKDGSLVVLGDVMGDGAILADKELRLRGSSQVDARNDKGVTLYGGTGVEIAESDAVRTGDRYELKPDPVADYFAAMPDEARDALSAGLPPGAPVGIEFFEWYQQQKANPGPGFKAWAEGTGPDNPGLSLEVRDWLDASAPVVRDLKAWAAQSGPNP